MRKKRALLTIVAFLVMALMLCLGTGVEMADAKKTKNLKSQVLEKGILRCAYPVYAPGVIKDPNTGKMSGIMVEVLEKAAQNMGIKIEWVGEVGWGEMIEWLVTNRCDVVAEVWANTSRATRVDFSIPIFYSGIGAYVRVDDHRFDKDLNTINDPKVKVSVIDGEMSLLITETDFPKAKRVSLPQLSQISQMLLNVKMKKADVAFVETYQAMEFIKNNPDSLRNVATERPLRVFGNTCMFRQDEYAFKAMLNAALMELINSGFVDSVIRNYEGLPGVLYRPALPYR